MEDELRCLVRSLSLREEDLVLELAWLMGESGVVARDRCEWRRPLGIRSTGLGTSVSKASLLGGGTPSLLVGTNGTGTRGPGPPDTGGVAVL
jgi:hypothetical protein